MIKIMIQGWNYKKYAQKESFDGNEAVFAPLQTYLALRSNCLLLGYPRPRPSSALYPHHRLYRLATKFLVNHQERNLASE